MKKLLAVMIGLGLLTATTAVSFAQDAPKTDTTKKKKKKGKKKDDTTTPSKRS